MKMVLPTFRLFHQKHLRGPPFSDFVIRLKNTYDGRFVFQAPIWSQFDSSDVSIKLMKGMTKIQSPVVWMSEIKIIKRFLP